MSSPTVKILIVDDDPSARKTLQDILSLHGYQAVACNQGKQAIQAAHDQPFNLALIDLKLPDHPGLEVMKAIKDFSPDTEFIVVTGYASQDTAIEAINLGAYAYTQKPLDIERLLLTIQHALERQQTRWALQKQAIEVSQLYEAGQQLGVTLNLNQVYERIYRVITDTMPCDGLTISAYNEQEKLIICQRCWADGVPLDVSRYPPIPLDKKGKDGQSTAILSGVAQIQPDTVAEKTCPAFLYSDQEGFPPAEETGLGQPRSRSAIICPIKLENRAIGVIEVWSNRPANYSADHLRFLEALTPMIAVAIANARLHDQVQSELEVRKKNEAEITRKADEFGALYETSQILSSQLDSITLIQAIVERAAQLLNSTGAYIYRYDPRRKTLTVEFDTGFQQLKGVSQSVNQGMAGWVLRENKPLFVEDYRLWPERVEEFAKYGFVSIVNVPLTYADQPIGVLGVYDKQLKAYTQDDIRLLELFGAQAASAIRNANLLEEANRRAAQMALLYDAGLALNSALEPGAQFDFLYKIAIDVLKADRASFFHNDPANKILRFELGIGYQPEILEELNKLTFSTTEETSLNGWVAVNRLPLNIPDLDSDLRYRRIDPIQKSGLFVPVIRKNDLLGVLSVFSAKPDAFSPDDERLLLLFANQAAVALENARLLNQTQRQLARLQALHRIDLAIISSYDLTVILSNLVDQTQNAQEVDAVNILLYKPDRITLESVVCAGYLNQTTPKLAVRLGEGVAGKAALER